MQRVAAAARAVADGVGVLVAGYGQPRPSKRSSIKFFLRILLGWATGFGVGCAVGWAVGWAVGLTEVGVGSCVGDCWVVRAGCRVTGAPSSSALCWPLPRVFLVCVWVAVCVRSWACTSVSEAVAVAVAGPASDRPRQWATRLSRASRTSPTAENCGDATRWEKALPRRVSAWSLSPFLPFSLSRSLFLSLSDNPPRTYTQRQPRREWDHAPVPSV